MISVQVAHNQLRSRRSWLCWLLVCVIFRAMIPTGFMPGAAASGDLYSWITLCYGNRDSAQLLSLAEHHHGHEAHHAAHAEEQGHAPAPGQTLEHDAHGSTDHGYCLFAGVAFNAAVPNEAPCFQLPQSSQKLTLSGQPFFPTPVFHPQLARAPPASSLS